MVIKKLYFLLLTDDELFENTKGDVPSQNFVPNSTEFLKVEGREGLYKEAISIHEQANNFASILYC